MLFLCRRGRENLREMTKTTFAIAVDSCGKEYVFQVTDELDKNHRENDKPTDNPGEGRMYALPGKLKMLK